MISSRKYGKRVTQYITVRELPILITVYLNLLQLKADTIVL